MRFFRAPRRKAAAIALAAVLSAVFLPSASPQANATTGARSGPGSAPAKTSPAPDDPKPYHRVERKESALHKELTGKRADFGPADPLSQAWAKHKISTEEYIDLSLKRVARPGDLPKEYRPAAELPSSAGLALGYALSMHDKKRENANRLIDASGLSVTSEPPQENASASARNAASAWPDCDAGDYSYLFHNFDCKRTLNLSRQINVYYSVDGLKPLDGVPAVDLNTNGVPDAIDTFVGSLSTAWAAYESWGYGWPSKPVHIFFGFDENNNPGLTLPFGDSLEDGVIMILPSDPGPDRYTYLAYHELFHATQYYYLPLLSVIVDLPSVNWWMEATAEWATHRMYNLVNPSAPGWDIYSYALDEFLGNPERAVNASTWPWQAHKRQYGAFLLAQYLTEQTDMDFVRHTWEEIPFDLPISSIAQVVEGYNLQLPILLQGFALANYRLTADVPDLNRFIGSPVGYRDPHATSRWSSELAPWLGRPKRSSEQALAWGRSANGSVEVYPGGTTYLEFTGPSSGQSRLTLQFGAQSIPQIQFRYFLVTWPATAGKPSATPSRWSRLDPREDTSGQVSIAVAPGEVATLIATRTDLAPESGTADSYVNVAQLDWNATMTAETAAQPNNALNTMWTNQATSAKCADWSGGDAVQSTRLPSGKRAWFFSDTFLGDPAKRGAGNETSYIRNSMVVQDGSTLRTVTGGSTCKETDPSTDFWSRYAKTPVGEGGQYWTGDSKVLPTTDSKHEVVKFYYEGTGDQDTRGAYARLPVDALETDNVLQVTPANLDDCSVRPPYPIVWGASLVDDGGYTYIYGWEADGTNAEKSLFLARTSQTTASAFTNQANWNYYAGTGSGGAAQWVESCSAAKPLVPKTEVDFSVIRLNGRFWLVHHTPAAQTPGKIVAVPSSTAWGFGSAQVDLYTPPETQTNPKYAAVYGARVHQNILSDTGKVSISYTVSTSATNVACWARGYYFPDNQYPRFVDVPTTAFFSTTVP
ncbi:hypothetical protein [Streptosporangium sp. NPDC049376]|uniref:hypothetical protein n=1 Tax=Streptosporangium sp. NPDC049376 TaxID=3366192 RepID=UPI0037899357